MHSRDMEYILPNLSSLRRVMLIHRPEEAILRFTPAKLNHLLRCFGEIILPGPSYVSHYQKLLASFPGSELEVKSIPHGFFAVGSMGDPWRYNDAATPCIVGTRTTWGELRRLADLISLSDALQDVSSAGGDSPSDTPYVVYASGRYEQLTNIA